MAKVRVLDSNRKKSACVGRPPVAWIQDGHAFDGAGTHLGPCTPEGVLTGAGKDKQTEPEGTQQPPKDDPAPQEAQEAPSEETPAKEAVVKAVIDMDYKELKAHGKKLELKFAGNIKASKLLELIQNAEANTTANPADAATGK